MIGTDYVGIGVLISAISAALVSIIVAVRQTATKQAVDEVHAAVSTSDDMTLGQVVEKIDRTTNGAATEPEAKP